LRELEETRERENKVTAELEALKFIKPIEKDSKETMTDLT
jgi:hypothetical protein